MRTNHCSNRTNGLSYVPSLPVRGAPRNERLFSRNGLSEAECEAGTANPYMANVEKALKKSSFGIQKNKQAMATLSPLPSAKQATLQLVERLNDDVSFEDIIYELYVLEKIRRGMKDAEEGRVVSHEEAKQRAEAKKRIKEART